MGVVNYEKLSIYLQKLLPAVNKIICINDAFIINIDKNWLLKVVNILNTNLMICTKGLLDIWCTDYPDKIERFELNYLLVSYKYNIRIILRVHLKDNIGIESLSNLFGSAGWLEREVWDMNGIFFYNNTDLRRILTDYGFEGFPLRKDFPMSGFVEIRYDDSEKRIVQESLEISQDYRNFNFKSPWEKL